jgi:hypothetical protein
MPACIHIYTELVGWQTMLTEEQLDSQIQISTKEVSQHLRISAGESAEKPGGWL